MSNNLDRLDMLKKLTLLKGSAHSIFKEYIPKHYDEIYTFYSLLESLSIKYSDIEFKKPILVDNSFIFCFSMSKTDFNVLSNSIRNNNKIKFMRKKSFNVNIKGKFNDVELEFIKKK